MGEVEIGVSKGLWARACKSSAIERPRSSPQPDSISWRAGGGVLARLSEQAMRHRGTGGEVVGECDNARVEIVGALVVKYGEPVLSVPRIPEVEIVWRTLCEVGFGGRGRMTLVVSSTSVSSGSYGMGLARRKRVQVLLGA